MASDFDPADFVDNDFQSRKAAAAVTPNPGASVRAPSREEVDAKVLEAQQRLAELKRAQEDLERERAQLEEARRRRIEFQTGRQEMLQNLARGVGLLEEAEFAARRDAEQMARTLADFREALSKLETINEDNWTKDTFNVELTRALTTIENARMEWNSARLKFDVLSGAKPKGAEAPAAQTAVNAPAGITDTGFLQLCKLGLAMTWPLTLATIGVIVTLLILLYR